MLNSQCFFNQLAQCAEQRAVIEGEISLSFAELLQLCDDFKHELNHHMPDKRQLVFLKAHNSISGLVAYLSCLQAGHPLMLLDPAIAQDSLANLVSQYQPNVLIDSLNIQPQHQRELELDSHLALLLSTSGSTGSAKQVCLSAGNLQANAQSICQYLPILPTDVTITTLPFFYSYGLSVINSHLLAGACIVFNQHSVVNREFWQLFKRQQITSFAGVPHIYDMLLRLKFERMDLPSLRYFTQAGGKLSEDKVSMLADYAQQHNKQFFVMYGQTEATARMAYVPSEVIAAKTKSIGRAIPGGEFVLHDEQGQVISQAGQIGELIYRGANVMLGYAEQLKDLVQLAGLEELKTGDLAYRDDDGDYVISGRLKRFIKLFGLRINLDEIENILSQQGLACYCLGDDSKLLVAVKSHIETAELKINLSRQLQLHHSAIEMFNVDTLPLTTNGKKDYPAMLQVLGR